MRINCHNSCGYYGFWLLDSKFNFKIFPSFIKIIFHKKKIKKMRVKKIQYQQRPSHIIALIHYVGGHIVKLIRDIHIPYSLSNQWTQKD